VQNRRARSEGQINDTGERVTDQSDSFIQEVDESLRQDRAMNMLRQYGPWFLGLVVVVLIGVGAWQWWESHQVSEARRQSDQFAAALEQAGRGDLDGAKTALQALSTQGPRAYRVMAQMEHAGILEAQGDLQGAIREFDAAAESAPDDTMRSTAQMRAAYLVADTQDFTAVQSRLQPIIDRGGPVSFLAQELLAVEAWEAGQTDLARTTLENLQLAFGAPEGVTQRAGLALSVIGPAPAQAGAPATETPAPQSAPAQGETP